MKIQCDVCEKEDASVFCTADEAALCDRCDRGVHHANKLAQKHLRFSLLHPSFQDSPLCDICQEKRALLFCKEDRAILCRECDVPLHKANEHTQKHNRFLLTGVKLSASSSFYSATPSPSPSPSPSSNACNATTDSEIEAPIFFTNKPISSYNQTFNPPSFEKTMPSSTVHDQHHHHQRHMSDTSSVSTSSISEYLETLPGWHIEEFLDPSLNSYGYCKLMDHDTDSSMTSFQSEAEWVPQFLPGKLMVLRFL